MLEPSVGFFFIKEISPTTNWTFPSEMGNTIWLARTFPSRTACILCLLGRNWQQNGNPGHPRHTGGTDCLERSMSCFIFREVFAQLEKQAYQENCMVPADTNREVAGYTVDELLGFVPKTFGLKAFGERSVICLLEDIVRESMLYVPHIFKCHSNCLTLSTSQISQAAMAPPHFSIRWSGTSCVYSTVVPLSSFSWKIPRGVQAPQIWRKGWMSSPPPEQVIFRMLLKSLWELK